MLLRKFRKIMLNNYLIKKTQKTNKNTVYQKVKISHIIKGGITIYYTS
jgi:hypothetical protein